MDSLLDLRDKTRAFTAARDWDQFHSPKNLSCALVVEAGELLEHFTWLSPEDASVIGDQERSKIGEEIADVLIYLVRLSDKLGIDPVAAAESKLAKNELAYPVELARGSSKKYTELRP